jgi:hypothetical protein
MSFTLYNQIGLVAFSDMHSNMRLLEKRTLTRTSFTVNNFTWNAFTTTVTSELGAPLLFAVPTGSGFITTYLHSISGNNYTFYTLTSDTQSGGATTMTVYIFVPDMIAAVGYGINVLKEDGTIAFSTTSRLLKTAGFYLPQQEFITGSTPAATYSLSSGTVPTNYAICSQSQGFQFLPVAGTGSFVLLHGGRIDSSSGFVRGSTQAVVAQTGAISTGTFLNGQLYVPLIDTTLYN